MTKKRVHEIAKELKISNKEIIDFLKEKNVDISSHMSSLDDEQVKMVKEKFQPSEQPKKKHIVQVFRPQNSRQASGRAGIGRSNNGGGGRPRQNRPDTRRYSQDDQSGLRQGFSYGQPFAQRPGRTSSVTGMANSAATRTTPDGKPRIPAALRPEPEKKKDMPEGTPETQESLTPIQVASKKPDDEAGKTIAAANPAATQDIKEQAVRDMPVNIKKQDEPAQSPAGSGYEGAINHPASGDHKDRYDCKEGGNERANAGAGSLRPNRNDRSERTERAVGTDRPQRGNGGFDSAERPGERAERQARFGERSERPKRPPERNDRPQRQQGRRDDRRGERRMDARDGRMPIPAPAVKDQKNQRQKQKEAYKRKDKDYRNEDIDEKVTRGRKPQKNITQQSKPAKTPVVKEEEKIKMITIPEVLTIKELADHMKIQPSVIIKKLFLQGKNVTLNQEIDFATAEEIAMEFEVLCEKEVVVDVIEELLKENEENEADMVRRPPVVCVMGHVDHGKTSLLDAIRNTSVTSGEAGGITQHIGAYVAKVRGENITFLDTPGHEAFTAMRMRGANSTDIAVLVVAADDGVMPQTVEAISHAKAAGIDIVVAVNKIDKPGANVDKVKQELTEHGLIPEDWGGDTIFVPVSAKTGEGIEDLMEMILLTAEVAELKANPNRMARGLVIEAKLDKGKGPVATVLVQKGTLHVGDPVVAGAAFGKVRAMLDDKGRRVKEAGPSTPVEILGLNDVPNAGEVFVGCETEKDARSFSDTFIAQNKVKLLDETKSKMSLDDLFSQIQAGNVKELGIIVKADVQGSVEALKQSLLKLSNEEVAVKVIHGGVGSINESDVTLASTSNAIIIGFNVRPDAMAKEIAERENVDIRLYDVIYNAIGDIEAAMKGMLDPVYEEKVTGHAEIRQIFKASGVGSIAGSYVLDGVIERGCKARIFRDDKIIYEGSLASLKRFKNDVKEVKAGFECGLVFDKFNDILEGDQVEAYKMVEVPR